MQIGPVFYIKEALDSHKIYKLVILAQPPSPKGEIFPSRSNTVRTKGAFSNATAIPLSGPRLLTVDGLARPWPPPKVRNGSRRTPGVPAFFFATAIFSPVERGREPKREEKFEIWNGFGLHIGLFVAMKT